MKNTPGSQFWTGQAFRLWMLCLALIVAVPVSAAELVLTSPPRETPEAGMKLYGPIAAYLSKLWGTRVVYKHPSNWLTYQRDMRDDAYDVIFDGPHFASWRMVHLGNRVAVRLPGTLRFALVVRADDASIKTPEDLIGKTICTLPPPNLATMTIINQFTNPARQPVIRGVAGGNPKVLAAFYSGECQAAVFRTEFVDKKFTDKDRAATRIIFTSKPLPNQVITVSKRVTPAEMDAMVQGLTHGPGVAATEGILKRFGGKSKAFIPAVASEFGGINNLLEGVIFGW